MVNHIYDIELDRTLCNEARGDMAVAVSGYPESCPRCIGMAKADKEARSRAYHPSDEEMRRAARQFITVHFGGCHFRASAFFREYAKANG